jgi:hypothetical protein
VVTEPEDVRIPTRTMRTSKATATRKRLVVAVCAGLVALLALLPGCGDPGCPNHKGGCGNFLTATQSDRS